MSSSRVVFDGLWRCLCPSVDAQAAARLLNSLPRPPPSLVTSRRSPSLQPSRQRNIRAQCRRPLTTASSALRQGDDQIAGHHGTSTNGSAHAEIPEVGTVRSRTEPNPDEQLRSAPLPAIYDALRVLQGQPKSFNKVATIITHLVNSRNVELSPILYEHLVAAMADVRGSAEMLAQLFGEMKQLSIKPTAAICHAALAALAVHPDYLIRNEVLAAMKQSWTEIDNEGESHIALGLLRDGQFELALDALETLIDKQTVKPWVYDIFISVFAQRGFVDEAVKLAHSKVHASDRDTHSALWFMLLDTCSGFYHYEGTRYIWGRMLDAQKEQLSDGVLLNVINTAARQHDFELATSAARLTTQRGGKLFAHHYEVLIECYGGIGDIASAFRVLCIMFKAISVAPYASTRTIYQWIKKRPESLNSALEALVDLVRDYKVPVAALNVLIEAAVETHGYAKALDIYQNAHKYTEASPNHVTIRYLLQACEETDSLMALVADNPELAMKGDRQTFARAIYEYAIAGELDLAYQCVELLGRAPEPVEGGKQATSGFWINRKTLLTLVRRSLDAQDERVWWLVDQAEKRNMDVQSGLSKLMASFAEEVKRSTGLGQEDGALEENPKPQHPSTS
ncbi:hypothetical protein CCHL11_01057 [Colletotrichum chlorophyti]|uniref:Pentatricopeptide repeat-containing protein-mitochondrial domain-containing protein n=1 Tax=Colletotrichum chlorophyti TaxID=708187 RepID=A0A1Q8S7H6_9PEZI|nr:hypothetical protein CCHL11_01057 [Colletotrichum chlorophyti]